MVGGRSPTLFDLGNLLPLAIVLLVGSRSPMILWFMGSRSPEVLELWEPVVPEYLNIGNP